MGSNMFETMRKTLAATLDTIAALEVKYRLLKEERAALEKLPRNEANPYWHNDKYLYLIHRTRDGYRPRKYIGNNPEKIAEALESIERFKKYQEIDEEMQRLKTRMMDAQFLIQQFESKVNGRGR